MSLEGTIGKHGNKQIFFVLPTPRLAAAGLGRKELEQISGKVEEARRS